VQAGQHVAQIAVTVTVTGLRSKVQWALGIRNQILLEIFITYNKFKIIIFIRLIFTINFL